MNREEIGNVNKPVANKEIEAVTKILPKNRSPEPDDFKRKLVLSNFQR